jgi:AraC-like DNA-binding protein
MTFNADYALPSGDVQWLVKQFEEIRFAGGADLLDKFIPRADVSLVFHFGHPPLMLQPVAASLPRFFLAPVISCANHIKLSEPDTTFVVVCKPTVLSRVASIDLSLPYSGYYPLPEKVFEPLWQRLSDAGDFYSRIAVFASFTRQWYTNDYPEDCIDRIYDVILETHGQLPVKEILNRFGLKHRTLQRKFMKRIGVCPKTLTRIVRVNYLWDIGRIQKNADYQDMVFQGRYYDQAHFIKDFKSITGETPDSFFRRDRYCVSIMSGKSAELPADTCG